MKEVWKDYEDEELATNRSFMVSNSGLVKKIYQGSDRFKIVEGTLNNGYRIIWIVLKDGKRTAWYVHKMVAETFLENPENKKYVVHLDHNKLNNAVENLQWANHDEWKEHNQHLFRKMKGRSRLNNLPNSKLTEKQVRSLKKKLANPNKKIKVATLAKQYNISEGQIYRIIRGDNWSHIKIDS
ncbi:MULTISPECIES: HNH endonuclease [Weeksella]|uniref:Phage related endodeoxyribonuclease n=1 Tax=Weeksella virosa (strain ATCC 43766 / DSM 16922 / JCM 21250 / CCUG 30538 / CDC 9751 / IAM 14551 / NBRC 16016 / NCTC 11634 / CL345/78) TaxID=865938 RepID=F0P0S3_WEEVC|nr:MULTISPECIES: HNH endonuclease [Weeksella]ADX67487.1 phage related endodeoxyribonuclease [Weeksella virosa DSM 16922]MDK7374287.1 HNH endonuclease [Weeksella virosa]MDK7675768.1 HNH endonuclease [Weeksella virosa]OFM82162.1 endodeoxyribonuclease [Weeksella sp. HMSC059D05]SUP53781.1 Uncharacterised protein [Weeksella virosa]